MIKKIIPYVILLACFVAGLKLAPIPLLGAWTLIGVLLLCRKKFGIVAFIVGGLLFAQTLSDQLVGDSPHVRLMLRIGLTFILGLCIFVRVTSLSRVRKLMPMGLLFVYVLYMIVPSTFGWFPTISYLKIVLFLLFAYGLICCAYLVASSAENIEMARVSVLAIAAFCIWASVITYWIPSIGYSMQVSKAAAWGISEYAALNSDRTLFSGIFFHSQTMGPVAVILAGFILCDMFFVERRLSTWHLSLAAPAPLLAYMSRSRTALLALGVILLVGFIVVVRDKSMAPIAQRRVRFAAWIICAALVCAAVSLEIFRGTLSTWISKGMESSLHGYELSDLTATRMGKVDENLRDFKKNPLVGKGFQTHELHRELFRAGVINYFSAPVEKGVLPLMVLGEGGIIGAIIFMGFICSFYAKCVRCAYSALVILMTGFLAVNMGEATFFSPSGTGGDIWFVFLIGGWSIDLAQERFLMYRRGV